MKDLNQLLESIERFEPDSADRDAVCQRIHHNRDYFSTLLESKADFLSLSRSIYRWYLHEHKRLRRGEKGQARMDPLRRPERSVSVPPLRMPARQAYKSQSLIIARHISSVNKEIAKEPPKKQEKAAWKPVRRAKGRIETPFGRNIERLKGECGWSYNDLYEATGISKTLLIGYVDHGKNAYPKNLKILADKFKEKLDRPVTVEELLSK